MTENESEDLKWGVNHDWEVILPPSRPSPYQLEVTYNQLRDLSCNDPIGILGATPEFRDLTASLEFENVYIFEKNISFLNHVEEKRAFDNHEEIVKGDWLDTLPEFSNYFSVILSDLASGNIHYKNHQYFYESIARALDSTGIFMDKILKNDAPWRQLESLDQKYKKHCFNLRTLNHFHCEYFFTSELLDENDYVDVDKFNNILKNRFNHPTLRKLLEENKRLAPSGSVWYYGRPWDSLQEKYFENLTPVDSYAEPEWSPYHDRASLLLSKPK